MLVVRGIMSRESSRPNDGTPWEGFACVLRDAVIELKNAIQVKLSTEEKFKRKIQKLKEKRKKDKRKHEEDLRILKEDSRILKKGHEDLISKIQEMRKEGCSEVNHSKTSPSEIISQLSQSTGFRLVIENSLITPIYKNETVETEGGGDHIRVVMYDGGIPIAPDHPLASVKVDLVLIEARFNEPKRDSWSREDFEKSMIRPREGIIRLVKNGTFDLIGGSCVHRGAIITDNSKKKEVKLAVMIAEPTEVRVLEGVSNPFKVQEVKTKSSKKNSKKPSPPVPTRNLVQPTSTYATQHEDNRVSSAPATEPLMVEGNGQALNGNGQKNSQQFPAQILGQSTSGYSMQHGQGYSWAPPSIQNPQAAGYCPVNQPLLARGQNHYTSLPNGSSELSHQNHSAYTSSNGIQSSFIPEDAGYLYAQPQLQETYGSFRCGQVLLQWDKPHVDLRERWNFLDQFMPLHSAKSRLYGERYPSKSLMDKDHKLMASISSGDSVWKMIASVTSQVTQATQRRGILIWPVEPYDSDDELPFKNLSSAKYQLRFVNRVCYDYYTREQIKSKDETFLRVALYDKNNLVVTSGPLSSASVEVVLLHGDFNAEGQDYWTPEEFSAYSLPTDGNFFPGEVPQVFGGEHVLELTDGEADLGNISFLIPSSLARTGKFKMGVWIKNVRQGIVQEGITSPFVVRVRLEEELCRHHITTLDELHRLRIELPNQVCGAPLVRDSRRNIEASSAMHHQSAPWKVWCIFVGQEVNNDEDISDPHTTKSLKRIMRAFGHRPRVSRELLILDKGAKSRGIGVRNKSARAGSK